jgi:hypothetical protein
MPNRVFAASANEAYPLPHTYNGINTDVTAMLQNHFMSGPRLLVLLAIGFLGLGYSLTKLRKA